MIDITNTSIITNSSQLRTVIYVDECSIEDFDLAE